jgi:hypothetical protein
MSRRSLYWEAHAKPTIKLPQKGAGVAVGLIYTKP